MDNSQKSEQMQNKITRMNAGAGPRPPLTCAHGTEIASLRKIDTEFIEKIGKTADNHTDKLSLHTNKLF